MCDISVLDKLYYTQWCKIYEPQLPIYSQKELIFCYLNLRYLKLVISYPNRPLLLVGRCWYNFCLRSIGIYPEVFKFLT